MKKFFLNLLCVCLLAIGLAGCNSPIDNVKSGVLDFDKSTTVGKAFDNYSCFKKTSWSEIKSKQGQVVVEFEGILDLTKAFSNYDNFRNLLVMYVEAQNNNTPLDESKFKKEDLMTFANDSMIFMSAKNNLEHFTSDSDAIDAMTNLNRVMKGEFDEKHIEKMMYECLKDDTLRKSDTRFIVQFKINKDDTFNISYVGVKINDKEYTYTYLDDLANIYSDKPMEVLKGASFKIMIK